ncbi:MAG: glycoside hydrolase family 15 protein [Chlamydiales bacterium]|nr:glycoside hydrolase family 15 protein [Chlamydiia bacterium]MCP5508751.1 glycoside hydrolase family 15 protein [Chlamydiales bacterium]
MEYQHIGNYGLIGDLQTCALVGINGSIDFMCFPYFDSPSIFARMLDIKKGGHFQVTPTLQNPKHKQLYLPDSNILLTRFLCVSGVAEVSDFMFVHDEPHTSSLIRRAKAVRGEIKFTMVCDPSFDYGRCGHTIDIRDGEVIFIPDNKELKPLRLRTTVPVKKHNSSVIAEFTLHGGETASFILEEASSDESSPSAHPHFVADAFKSTMNFWQKWISRSTYTGRWREMVNRSALTLKMLTSKIHGSIVAAPTFGLPEEIGGERNWDYRYTWIRDASFTLYGLIRLGFTDEAKAFMDWIEARCDELNPDGSLQIMYAMDGRHQLTEETLNHFEGYMGSSPVRIGNGAYNQLQLDIYGELMDSVYLYNKYGEPISIDLWRNLTRLLNWVCDNWNQADEGIWEVRGGKHEFLYSRLMCWVALDRGVRLAQKRSFPAPLMNWLQARDAIYNDILENFWDPKRKIFVQYKHGTALDASNLLMPLVKFISPTDPRWLSTLSAIERDLVDDSLVYRYRTGDKNIDGLIGAEGTFNMCSFWYVENLSRSGDVKKARFIFEKMLGYANHLGLFAEELGSDGTQLGNFPQAFTHLGLISAAYNLDLNLNLHHIEA